MDKKVFIVTDLGGGDGGKGGVVHKLCSMTKAHTVVKVGGAQGSHGVRTAKGEEFCFSQFGCGTFNGARTHISNLMVIDPSALVYEGNLLRDECGVNNAFDLLTIDERALCTTPFHQIASRLRELARKDKPKGTIGVGVGEAVTDSERFPDLALKAGDIGEPYLLDKLEEIRAKKIIDLQEIIDHVDQLWPDDQKTAKELIEVLKNPNMPKAIKESWDQLLTRSKIVSPDYLGSAILSLDGTVVVESSHGVLTDRYYGFHPHTTKLRTLPEFTLRMLSEAGYGGKIIKFGVTRAYSIRHGAGPMVTEKPELLEKLLPGSNKEENRWQGKVRVGPLDMVALRYAINACGGPEAFDCLAITWFDQIGVFGHWPVCERYYAGTSDRDFFSPQGELIVRRGNDQAQLDRQQILGDKLKECLPQVTEYRLGNKSREESNYLCRDICQDQLGLPVGMISFGPTEDDKVCF